MIKERKETFLLSRESIDKVSEICWEALSQAEVDRKDMIRLRLSLEEILEIWLQEMEEGAVISCRTGTKFGKQFIEFRVPGRKMAYGSPDDENAELLSNRLLAQAGISLIYSYQKSENILMIQPPKKKQISTIMQIMIAVLAAILTGIISGYLPTGVQTAITAVLDPLLQMILGVFRAIASPMIFLAVSSGIIMIGDLNSVGKIGKRIFKDMTIVTFLVGSVAVMVLIWFYPFQKAASMGNLEGMASVYQLILDIVPFDIISPFLNGNALQVVFLGICVGSAVLFLDKRALATREVIESTNEVVQTLMKVIGSAMPLFIFLSVYSLVTSGVLSALGSIVQTVIIILAGCFILMGLYIILLSWKFKVSARVLIKKLLPVFVIGITTASSAATFSTNMEIGEQELGIPKKILNFAIPLGQVVFMPAVVIVFLGMTFPLTTVYDVDITFSWLITAVLVSGLLAMALPPIPGGALTCYTILFTELGIPMEALAIVISIDLFFDFIGTATNIVCLLAELMLSTDRMGMLDREKLKKQK